MWPISRDDLPDPLPIGTLRPAGAGTEEQTWGEVLRLPRGVPRRLRKKLITALLQEDAKARRARARSVLEEMVAYVED